MKVRLEYISDTAGNNYIGANIYGDIVTPYLNKLEQILGDDFQEYITYQKNRDHGKYHITIINAMNYNEISKKLGVSQFINSLDKYFTDEFEVRLMGIGMAQRNENTAYFIVVQSEELQEIRKIYGLPEQDFHITIGFKWRDVFGVRKNQVMDIHDPFLKLLSDEYYKNNESFEFVKTLQNFDGDNESDVEAIKIGDSIATFRIGENRYFSVSLIGGVLMVSAKWEDNEKKPILSNTLISRKLKK